MTTSDISIFSLAGLLIFLVPILLINFRLKLEINRTLMTSVLRMCLQLAFVGLYLEFLFRFDSAVLNVVYLFIMITIACHSIIKSSKLSFKRLYFPVFVSLLIPFSITLLFFNAFVIHIQNLFEARYLVPIGGMLLGNCLRSIIIGLNHFYTGIREDEKTYLYSLSLYNNRYLALSAYFKSAFLNAIMPTLASMSTIGLVSLPGMMTGQILGGSIPIVAIKYQVAIMFCIFQTEYFSTMLSILLSLKFSFNTFDVLNKQIFSSNNSGE